MAEEKFPNLASLFGQGGHGERGREPSAPSAGRGYGGRGGAEERAGLMSQQDAHCASALDAAELRTAASAPALVGPAPTALGARSGASAGGAPPGDERHASPPRDAERPRPGALAAAASQGDAAPLRPASTSLGA
ncbi:unnamed protein product [Prorocentrum cordatum]|uniref:Uncharacterized protein n=1 Tax=Prorocentrum cordatum TaxID=2364126 RepID=A0ABN9Y2Q8_9DINO|nr:unnamed protein product [Polarella glacialis]